MQSQEPFEACVVVVVSEVELAAESAPSCSPWAPWPGASLPGRDLLTISSLTPSGSASVRILSLLSYSAATNATRDKDIYCKAAHHAHFHSLSAEEGMRSDAAEVSAVD